MSFLNNPAMWSSLAALLAAIGVVVPEQLTQRVVELFAALCAVIGIVECLWRRARQPEKPHEA